jgi:hypothetical protein
MRQHPEDDLQRAVAQYLDIHGWLWCHCPNGGKRNAREAARLKGMGVKPGVPDVLIFETWCEVRGSEPTVFEFSGHGIAIELKSPKGRTTKTQDAWLAGLRRRGWKTAVCRSIDEVVEVTKCIK